MTAFIIRDYDQACDTVLTREEAKAEIDAHQVPEAWNDFINECGYHPTYRGKTVLDFLGY